MAYRWKPSSSDRAAYAAACREIEARGLKISKSRRGLSIYGINPETGKQARVSNHALPDHHIQPEEMGEENHIFRSQREVFAFWGVEL